jgi:outer membrane protein OmpA-like peptidoglycan-associated protein
MRTRNIFISLLGIIFLTGVSFAGDLKPTYELALLNVKVSNTKKVPLEGETVSFISTKTKKEYKSHTNAEGKFSLLLPIGDTYDVCYSNFTEQIKYNRIEIPGEEAEYTIDYEIIFEPARIFVLKNVEYDFDKASLRKESFETLDMLVEVMKLKDKMEIEIAGHTDNLGTAEYNLKLSQDRAESVRRYLISKGVNGNRITAKGYGFSQPVAPNAHPDGTDNPEGRQQNRRTEIRVTKQQ